jgi:uncharacterized protein (UPF0333 family)
MRNKAQVSLELSAAIVALLILVVGSLNLFIWLNKRIMLRQRDYESSRPLAASAVDQSKQGYVPPEGAGLKKLEKLNILNEKQP